MAADLGVRSIEIPSKLVRLQRPQTVERIQGVHDQKRVWFLAEQLVNDVSQHGHGGHVALLDEKLLRHVALPTAGTIQGRDQFRRRQLIKPWNRAWLLTLGINAVNS